MGKKQVDVFATEGLSLNLSGSADGRDGRDGRGISNTQTLCKNRLVTSLIELAITGESQGLMANMHNIKFILWFLAIANVPEQSVVGCNVPAF